MMGIPAARMLLSSRVMLGVLVACAIIVIVPVLERLAASAYIYDEAWTLPHAQAVMILGASVKHGQPSPILLERAQQAVYVYRLGLAPRIIVSGDAQDANYNEVTPVRDYLLSQGVPAESIFLDPSGFDTYSSMYRARHVFGAQSLIVVSQDFHLPRAIFIARALGIDASGSIAQGGKLSAYIREIPASWKALFDVVSGRQSKYVGAPQSLEGSGLGSWKQ